MAPVDKKCRHVQAGYEEHDSQNRPDGGLPYDPALSYRQGKPP
jgi:hypothetical protein